LKRVKPSKHFTVSFREIVFFFLILLLDFASKYWVVHNLPYIQTYAGFPFGGIGIINTAFFKFSIVHMTNAGTAWGLFSNFQIPLLIVRMVVTVGILIYLLFFQPQKFLRIPFFIIAAGALGNILDFFLYGHVIDMFYMIFYHYSYPVFNIADAAIFCSVAYLILRPKSHAASH